MKCLLYLLFGCRIHTLIYGNACTYKCHEDFLERLLYNVALTLNHT